MILIFNSSALRSMMRGVSAGIPWVRTWSAAFSVPTPTGSPCEGITPEPSTDNGFELSRIIASMRKAERIPVRGN